jgi:hypothetical protein
MLNNLPPRRGQVRYAPAHKNAADLWWRALYRAHAEWMPPRPRIVPAELASPPETISLSMAYRFGLRPVLLQPWGTTQ